MRTRLALATVLLLGGLLPGFRQPSPAVASQQPCRPTVPATCTLRQLADRLGLRIGATLEPDQIADADYAQALATQFNAVTPENAMKWYSVQPTRGTFDFTGADAVVDFAEAHDQEVRGHNLVWAQDTYTPDWVEAIADRDELWGEMQAQVHAVMDRYRGRVHRYDVLNEPLASTGTGPSDSVFHRVLQPDWIADLFRYAHEQDPSAELWLNEFGTDFVPGKQAALVELVRSLVDAGVPIDGVGIQGHRFAVAGPDQAAFEGLLRDITGLGLKVAVTEVDVATDPTSPTAFADQAAAYGRIVGACLAVTGCEEVTTWGITDASTWLDDFAFLAHPSRPLLFDDQFRPKHAYETVRAALATAVVAEEGGGVGGGGSDPPPADAADPVDADPTFTG